MHGVLPFARKFGYPPILVLDELIGRGPFCLVRAFSRTNHLVIVEFSPKSGGELVSLDKVACIQVTIVKVFCPCYTCPHAEWHKNVVSLSGGVTHGSDRGLFKLLSR